MTVVTLCIKENLAFNNKILGGKKMYKKFLQIIQIAYVTNCFFISMFAQDKNYGYENWPGKRGVVKSNIILNSEFVNNHKMLLAEGSKENSLFYKISLGDNDTLKKGRLQAEVFSSVEEAQLALVEYLECLATINKPPRLTYEDFKAGDVAFGREYDGLLWMAFTRNNILIVIHAPIKKAMSIAQEVDKKIQNAPEWNKETPIPSFILAK